MEKTIQILLVDDEKFEADILRSALNEIPRFRFQLDWLPDYESAISAMTRNDHDVYLVDFALGGRNGLDLIQEGVELGCKKPILLYTSRGDTDISVRAIHSGAMDFIDKGMMRPSELERSLRNSMARESQISRSRQADFWRWERQKLRSLETMAGGLVHELNNLLGGMWGYLELAQMLSSPNSKIYDYLGKVENGIKSASFLVDQLLLFAGKTTVGDLARINLVSTLHEIKHHAQLSLNKNLTIETQSEVEELNINGNLPQITQACMSLIFNAAEAIQPTSGRISLFIGTRVLTDGAEEMEFFPSPPELGEYAIIGVYDNGPGMDKHIISRSVDPFFSTKSHERGLGLSIAMGIAKTHHGALRLRSVPGHGTFAELWLALPKVPYASKSDTPGLDQSNTLTASQGKILFVEDDINVKNTLETALSSNGYYVHSSMDGKEALSLFQKNPGEFNAVILGGSQPGLSGLDIAKQIRKQHPELAILFTSGLFPSSEVQQLLDKHTVFMRKPFSPKVLVQSLSMLIRKPQIGKTSSEMSGIA